MVNVENVKALLSDLRSGKFAQTHSRLGVRVDGEDAFCCEGVGSKRACEALSLEIKVTTLDASLNTDVWWFDGQQSLASGAVARFYGFEVSDNSSAPGWIVWLPSLPRYAGYSQTPNWRQQLLSDLNDNGFSFEQIADVIEWYYLNGGQSNYEMWKESRE